MKKIILILFSIVFLNTAFAQEEPYLMQMHYIEVDGNIDAFIKLNSV